MTGDLQDGRIRHAVFVFPTVYLGTVGPAGDVVSGTLVVDSQSYGVVSSTISSGVILLDFSENNNFDVTLEGNSTLAPSVSPSGGQSGAVYIRQDGTFLFRRLEL